MCGRLVLTSSFKERIKALLSDILIEADIRPRYNITPGQVLPVITDPGLARITDMRWGFPSRHRPADTGPDKLLINARGETVHSLPTFRDAFKSSRCLVLADGFYEWKRTDSDRPQPYYFALKSQAPLLLAGIWSHPRGPDTGGCAIITTEANQLMHPVHNRMPVILDPEGASLWLQPEASAETLRHMLQPHTSSDMSCHPVGQRVNRSDSEGEDLIAPVRIIEQTELF